MNVTPVDTANFTPAQQTAFGNASQQGSGVPTYNSANPTTPTVKPVTTISTQQGVDALNKTKQQADNLAGTPPANTAVTKSAVDTTKGTDTPTSNKVTLINPDTGQKVTFNDASINKDNIQNYLGSGYHLSEAEGNLPDWLAPTTTGTQTNPDMDASKTALTQAKSDLSAATAKLTSFDITNDPQLKTLLDGVSSIWDQRLSQYQNSEDSRIAALNTTGIRLGSQWTGGKGGMTGSIISGEEKAAIDKIAGLQQQKQQALAAAQTAFSTNKWKQYNDLVQVAQKAYEDQMSQVKTLQTAQATHDTKLQAAQNAAVRDANISSLFGKGVTDPSEILSNLQDSGDDTTSLKDITAAIKSITPKTDATATLKFSNAQLGKLYAGGLSRDDVQAVSDYYNGKGDASTLSDLTPEQQKIIHDTLNGTSPTKPGGTTKPYVSGSFTYTADDLGKVQKWISGTKGQDGYVDPNAYKEAYDAWTNDGGLAKDFLKNFPPKTYVNPANDWLPSYLSSKTSTKKPAADMATQINQLFTTSNTTPAK